MSVSHVEMPIYLMLTAPSFQNFTLNQSTDFLEIIFQAEENITITRVGVRQGSVTGTAPQYKISLQGVGGDGLPDGTIKGGGTPASALFTPAGGNNNTFQWFTLDNSYACSRGERLALVVGHNSGTIDTSNNCSFSSAMSATAFNRHPYVWQNDNGSRTTQNNEVIFGYGSSTAVYGRPIHATLSGTFTTERGMRFTIPTYLGASVQLVAIKHLISWNTGSGGLATWRLYDTDGDTVLQSIQIDQEQQGSTAGNQAIEVVFANNTLATLTTGNTYRIGIQADNNACGLQGFEVAAAADQDAFPFQQAIQQCSRNSGPGAWTDSAVGRYNMVLVFATLTPPSGGGGGLAGPVIGPCGPVIRGLSL